MSANDGYYFDTNDDSMVSIIQRNINTALNVVKTGEAGATAMGVVLGVAASWGLKRLVGR